MTNIKWLREQRIKLGLTLEQVGSEMFVTKQTIGWLEQGKPTSKLVRVTYERVILKHLEEDYQI
jgi:transcriptional regulator with XRE-family HTH domain